MTVLQSARDLDRDEVASVGITRGVRRLLDSLGYTTVCELTLPNGRRADIVALSASGQVMIVEVKSSAADFRADRKWPEYVGYCDQMFFAVAADGPADLIPPEAGLIVSDAYSAEISRDAAAVAIAPARRRAVLLAFARHAAGRLHALQDPHLVSRGEVR